MRESYEDAWEGMDQNEREQVTSGHLIIIGRTCQKEDLAVYVLVEVLNILQIIKMVKKVLTYSSFFL